MEDEIFALLRLGLGNSKPEQENLSNYIMLSAEQWTQMGDFAQEQGVLGIMLDGIDCLETTGYGVTRNLSKEQKIEWIGNVLNGYEARNLHQLAVINDLQTQWAKVGLRMLVIKGQAIGTYYPVPKHRAPGDIDCYLFNGYAKGNELAKRWADNVDEGWYKHSVISYKGETIENHQFFAHTREGKRSKLLNQLLCKLLDNVNYVQLPGTNALLPPAMFNAVFLTYHAMSHFLEEGLRLKQLIDWAVFLKHFGGIIDWPEFYRICKEFHLHRFADVATDIAVHHLGVEINNPQITPSSPYTEKVIESVFNDKDFVFNSGKSKWSNRWHIVTNLFKYRWKYNLIYEESIIKQLWWYVVGFINKSE